MHGETTAQESRELHQLLDGIVDKDFDALCDQLWKETAAEHQEMDPAVKARLKQRLDQQINAYEAGKRLERRKLWKRIALSTAAAAALFVAGFTGYVISDARTQEVPYILTCDKGERSTLTLPDGTQVQLNSASSLTYSSTYDRESRAVQLEGEAFFDVARDEKHPFTVTAGEMTIRVLGTKFNVRAYAGSDEVEATLQEGRIIATVGNRQEELQPDERLCYNRKTGAVCKTSGLPAGEIAPWVSGELCFHHSRLEDIATELERMYDVDIIFGDETIAEESFTGRIKDNSLTNVLDLISSTAGLTYRMTGSQVVVTRK